MSLFGPNWPPLGEHSLAKQAAELSSELRLYRDLRYEAGTPESYQLTGLQAQLQLAADLLDRSYPAQELYVRMLIDECQRYLRQLRGEYDA